ALPVLPALRVQGHRLPRGRRGAGHPPAPLVRLLRPPVHHRRGGGARRRQAQRRHRAVQPGQGRGWRPARLPGPPRRRGRPGPARPPRRGGRPRGRHRRDPEPRGGAGHPRSAPRARRGRLPPFRQRLPLVLLHRGLREGDRRPARAAGRRLRL
ncbi:MAG: Ribonucleotide reductase transcriptional regulator NrdR, partial [uncultured Pseudonocardia sp.]